MRCPHCDIAFHDERNYFNLAKNKEGWSVIKEIICPDCRKVTLFLLNRNPQFSQKPVYLNPKKQPDDGNEPSPTPKKESSDLEIQIYPKRSARAHCPVEVPEEFAEDFNEACVILYDSPRSAAALGRRCLQHLLREKGGIEKSRNLMEEIERVINKGGLPSAIINQIDAIRHYGNFAAHPEKSRETGEIIPIEPEEAEWTLDILEELFDHYFVQPVRIGKKIEKLNNKLVDTGNQKMKDRSP